jgi:hypothetical protein
MEAMIIVGLCLGSFVKGPDHELAMKTFIKHVTAIAPLIEERRKLIRGDTIFFLAHSRETLFELWDIKSKTWNGSRMENGRFSKLLDTSNGPVLKKPRKEKFDFKTLREDKTLPEVAAQCSEV